MQRATVVLPQPDSPTSENVSPRLIEKLTPSIALTEARGLPCSSRSSAGGDTSKWRLRSLTSRMVSSATTYPSRQPSPRKRGEGARRYLTPLPACGEREGPTAQPWEGEGPGTHTCAT